MPSRISRQKLERRSPAAPVAPPLPPASGDRFSVIASSVTAETPKVAASTREGGSGGQVEHDEPSRRIAHDLGDVGARGQHRVGAQQLPIGHDVGQQRHQPGVEEHGRAGGEERQHEHAARGAFRHERHHQHQATAGDVGGDHDAALVDAIEHAAGDDPEQDVGQREQREDHARGQRRVWVVRYTIQGKATIARRSPICEMNCPPTSSTKLELRANGRPTRVSSVERHAQGLWQAGDSRRCGSVVSPDTTKTIHTTKNMRNLRVCVQGLAHAPSMCIPSGPQTIVNLFISAN